MSGTSLDGVDLAYCVFTYENKNWIYKILNTTTFPYTVAWEQRLRDLMQVSGAELISLDHAYGQYLGELINTFIRAHNLDVDFISSHGHTVYHQPGEHLTLQIGNGAYLAAATGLPVVCDFRTLDVALGGQGAPLVPIGDQLLFSDYEFCLNLGGIANISFAGTSGQVAYDICACNILLNTLASELNLAYDQDGHIASTGKTDANLLQKLNTADFLLAPYPKSLGKEWVDANSLKWLAESAATIPDKLQTACEHIATQIAAAIKQTPQPANAKVLTTGGGALNKYLIQLLQEKAGTHYQVVVPEPELVNYKEALIFAFLGVLRWEQQPNSLRSVTGARRNNIGGAIYIGT